MRILDKYNVWRNILLGYCVLDTYDALFMLLGQNLSDMLDTLGEASFIAFSRRRRLL